MSTFCLELPSSYNGRGEYLQQRPYVLQILNILLCHLVRKKFAAPLPRCEGLRETRWVQREGVFASYRQLGAAGPEWNLQHFSSLLPEDPRMDSAPGLIGLEGVVETVRVCVRLTWESKEFSWISRSALCPPLSVVCGCPPALPDA